LKIALQGNLDGFSILDPHLIPSSPFTTETGSCCVGQVVGVTLRAGTLKYGVLCTTKFKSLLQPSMVNTSFMEGEFCGDVGMGVEVEHRL
jgi:hypothetical protein